MLQGILTEVNSMIAGFDRRPGDFVLPSPGTPIEVIQGYLRDRQTQRVKEQLLDDLVQLRNTVQAEINRIAAEELAAKQKAEA